MSETMPSSKCWELDFYWALQNGAFFKTPKSKCLIEQKAFEQLYLILGLSIIL